METYPSGSLVPSLSSQRWSKITRFCMRFLLFAKYFVRDCSNKTTKIFLNMKVCWGELLLRLTLQIPADLVTFTEEILNRKLHFLCSVSRHTRDSRWSIQTTGCSTGLRTHILATRVENCINHSD